MPVFCILELFWANKTQDLGLIRIIERGECEVVTYTFVILKATLMLHRYIIILTTILT